MPAESLSWGGAMRAKVEALWVRVAEIEMLPEQLFHRELTRTKENCVFPPMNAACVNCEFCAV